MEHDMLTSTTDTLEGYEITEYLGIVTGETISGANVVRDFMATVTDYVGGRSAAYEEILGRARDSSMTEMVDRAQLLNADAIIGVHLDYEVVGSRGAMLMVSCAGTAVRLRRR